MKMSEAFREHFESRRGKRVNWPTSSTSSRRTWRNWMKKFKTLIVMLGIATLAACANPAPISTNPAADVISTLKSIGGPSTGVDPVTQGLIDAAFNLDSAQKIGILDANDAMPPCVHSVLTDLGINPDGTVTPNTNQFTPRISDLIGAGSVLYIRTKQAQKLQASGLQTSIACDALLGQIVRAAAKAGIKIGGSLASGGLASPILNLLP